MARPVKIGLDYFPQWSPKRQSVKNFHSLNFKVSYRALRSSSDAFIKRSDVRQFVLNKSNCKCAVCGGGEGLQIDHISSVYAAAKNKQLIETLNTLDNLQALCGKCNSSKTPN